MPKPPGSGPSVSLWLTGLTSSSLAGVGLLLCQWLFSPPNAGDAGNQRQLSSVGTFESRDSNPVVQPAVNARRAIVDASGLPNADANSQSPPASPPQQSKTLAQSGRMPETASQPSPRENAFREIVPAWADVNDSVRIPFPDIVADDSLPAVSGVRPAFLQFKRSLYDVNTGHEVAKLPAEFSSDKALLSSDGRRIARYRDSGSRLSAIYIHSTEAAADVRKLDMSRYREIHWIQFLNSTQLLVLGTLENASQWSVWNVDSGENVAEFMCIPPSSGTRFCLNLSGSRMAMMSANQSIQIYNLINGQVEKTLEDLSSIGDRSLVSLRELRFSPDGKELAAIFYPSSIAVWSVDGTLLEQESIPEIQYNVLHEDTGFCWLPDGSGWLVAGRKLIDRKSFSVAWEIRSGQNDPGSAGFACFLSQDQVLVSSGADKARQLVPLRIPWNDITKKLALLATSESVAIKAGAAVSVKLEVGGVRLASEETVNATLRAAVAEVLSAAGLQDASGQPVQMVVRSAEMPVADRSRGLFSLIPAQDVGSSEKTDTQVTIVIELRDSATGDLYWQSQVETSGAFAVRGEISEQSLRDAAFSSAMERITRIRLPTRLCKGSRIGIPVVSNVP